MGHGNEQGPLLVTSGGQDWTPIQTCSLEDLPCADIWCLLKNYVLLNEIILSFVLLS